ncbi:alkaline phosphatase, partial [Mesorhizobium sp. M1A.F.Ca.IN.022.05.2.1]
MPGDNPPRAGKAVSGGHEDSITTGSAAAGGALSWRAGARLGTLLAAATSAAPLLSVVAHADTGVAAAVSTVEVMQLAMFAGVMGAALVSAIFLIRERARTASQNVQLRARIADVNAALQRSEALLNLRDQRVVVWSSEIKKPELIGSLPLESGAPDERPAFLAFGRWLMPRSAAALENAIAALRDQAKTFDLVIETQAGMPLEVHGRKSAAHVLVRFISLSETLRSQARLKVENQRLSADYDTMLGLLDALKMPTWLRAADGRLKWVNRAYAEAVEAESAEAAVREAKEFLGGQAREQIAEQHKSRPVFEQTLSTVIEGDRHMFSVTDFASADGSAGLACDISAIETIRAEYERTVRSHADTLDQLNTAVAIFDTDENLRFFNQAFQK